MAGQTSHKVQVGILDIATGKVTYLDTGDPTDRYFTNIAWSPDEKTVYMFELNRGQNDCRLVSYNATTGEKIAELYRETSDKYVEPQNPIQFLPWDDTKFIMLSQKDGFNHLYLFDTNGKELKQLTSGQWVVMDVVGFNTKKKSILYTSNEIHPTNSNLWTVDVKSGKRSLLGQGIGVVKSAQPSASGQQVALKFSSHNRPRVIDLINVNTWKVTNLLEAEDPWKDYQQPIFTCGSIKAADGVTDLFYRMVKPHDFDATKKYPMFTSMADHTPTTWMHRGTMPAVRGRPTWPRRVISSLSWTIADRRIVDATSSRPPSTSWDRSRCRTR